MSLRRFAQANNATSLPGSPRSTPQHVNNGAQTPSTPRSRVSYVDSPSSTPSISSIIPFDWEAARSRRPPPYATPPTKRKPRMSGVNGRTGGTPKRVIKKKGMLERISAIPSRIMFEISLFPHNVPLPAPKTSAWLIGASMHLLHLCVRVSQIQEISDSDLGWEDMYWERDRKSWLDWTVPATFILLAASTLNVLHLFTQTRVYQLHKRNQADAVNSPHATFVSSPARASSSSSNEPAPTPSFRRRLVQLFVSLLLLAWRLFLGFWRFLLGITPATPSSSPPLHGANLDQIQQLEIWTPGELEGVLLSIYSPVHALLWVGTSATNWMLMCFVMGAVGVQTSVLMKAYEGLVKDRAILASEVMHEYNQGFVYPRMFPIKKDVAVMTHQSEMVNIWED
ncbi:hypothetical protein BJ138DRAFT_1170202 [Hygrophoropsis aurantiaca]|uniref:Uncharacterized protein n=1 Tax=Hygrophoropsis aurantiaca TaxID=72124 RepID=A0ACB8APU5_9AGAM|nr:hypothetical protein BJ138DRAFT_1170202 [Hygrophoropsis aurantiaca]